ncbi:ROK family transcriptional regulator [Sporolituus thermophilus]|uniref:Sugar kinase of the NBD/HSP70 family, may contain an N-terminal HTH domain n=1 Tax=Sporolituus thermophilus DSM 23256 TaxID=1123285 RepID=A0A1G7IN78_9FIRM|nr:ROK family transcriptional regulator [Sporolituus thermophilus]SDF13749.1 Sugar kinase of the NBD/HSP70 family, may contain an N-terminal HTH domain [Sporolituus thermophilus DSM 23256]
MPKAKPPGNVQTIKRLNREAILQCLRENGRLSRASLAKMTSLSKPGVSAIVSELLQEGLLREVGEGASSGGRKPILLELNSDQFFIMAAVFEGMRLELALANLDGAIVAAQSIRVEQSFAGQDLSAYLQECIATFLKTSAVDSERLLGIGVGLPGITRRGSGKISFSPITDWHDWPIKEELEQRFVLPVMVDNDVNLMALGEFYKGAGKGRQHVVYIYVGTGIGAGIILNGQLYRGVADAAGEIGYMMIGRLETRISDKYGTFEGNYSTLALYNRVKKTPGLNHLATDHAENIILKLVREATGCEVARSLLEEACLKWCYGIANVVSVLNPELVILGGDMPYIGAWGIDFIRTNLAKLVPVVPEVQFAELRERAGIMGAVYQVLESDRSLSGSLKNAMRGEGG